MWCPNRNVGKGEIVEFLSRRRIHQSIRRHGPTNIQKCWNVTIFDISSKITYPCDNAAGLCRPSRQQIIEVNACSRWEWLQSVKNAFKSAVMPFALCRNEKGSIVCTTASAAALIKRLFDACESFIVASRGPVVSCVFECYCILLVLLSAFKTGTALHFTLQTGCVVADQPATWVVRVTHVEYIVAIFAFDLYFPCERRKFVTDTSS